MQTFGSFREFYAFYLTQHSNRTSRRLHLVGTLGGLALTLYALLTQHWLLLLLVPVFAYGCSWTGHYAFEKNTPAVFGHPVWSFRSDFVMCWDILRGRIKV